MAARYDAESLCDDLEAILKAGLNTKIAEISAEKDDGLSLATIEDDAYFFQTLGDRAANFNPIILYGVEDQDPRQQGEDVALRLTLVVMIIFSYSGQENVTGENRALGKMLMRYGRALEETLRETWGKSRNRHRFEIKGRPPIAFGLANRPGLQQGVGVEIEAFI
jgi:hypothetical protein